MAWARTNLTEGVQLRRARRAEELVPGIGAKPHNASEAGFNVAKFHRANEGGEVCAEGAKGGAAVGAGF